MASLRYDVTTGDFVVFSSARGKRPDRWGTGSPPPSSVAHDPACAFCVGQEASTPETIDFEPDLEDPSRWGVRLVANKYPALEPRYSSERHLDGPLFREMGGHGRHEVLIESPHHSRPLWQQPRAHVIGILSVLHRRFRALAGDERLEVVQPFKNHGASAGSSIPHPHFQLIATPVVPRTLRTIYQVAADHYQVTGRSVYVELCEAERTAGVRVVAQNDAFLVFSPYAARAPYAVRILPLHAQPTFGMAAPETLPILADTLIDVLNRLQTVLHDAPFNLVFNSAPRRHADEPDFVWHIDILPRLAQPAGFELATGMVINPLLPELAAEQLRQAR